MRHIRPSGRQAGFTLIELMVVIAILGVLAGIGIPSYITYLPKSRLNGATSTIMADLMGARMKASKLNRKVKVYFIDSHQYRICDDADNNGTVGSTEGDAVLKDIQAEYSDVSFSANRDPIFSPRGTASNFGSIVVTNSSGTKTLAVSITGIVRISED